MVKGYFFAKYVNIKQDMKILYLVVLNVNKIQYLKQNQRITSAEYIQHTFI